MILSRLLSISWSVGLIPLLQEHEGRIKVTQLESTRRRNIFFFHGESVRSVTATYLGKVRLSMPLKHTVYNSFQHLSRTQRLVHALKTAQEKLSISETLLSNFQKPHIQDQICPNLLKNRSTRSE
jgi:hypothetical protein